MKSSNLLILLFSITLLVGCTSSGAFISTTNTSVNLEEDNYSISAGNVSGEAESAYILGLSFSSGLLTNTIAIARVEGSDALYADALANLWANYEAEHGSIVGQNLALANVRYDADILNLLLYTKVKVTVRADVIEFE